jgi:TolB-like protein
MTDDRWERVDLLYHAALEREADDRAAFLDKACGGDEVLLREVQSLLAYEASSAAFLERSALEEAAKDLAADEGPSTSEKQIAGYQVLSLLGEGGMGEVYRARDVRLDREVALKILAKEIAGHPGFVDRFEEEARSASGLNHPNIVTIYGVGESGDVAYIAMELVQGRTLRELVSESPLSVRATLDLAVQLADALSAAHARGIVHRDLKPENVMVTPDGLVKVLDFGIAKSDRAGTRATEAEPGLTSRVGRTEAGTILGTIGYMSPEQAAGLPAGPASDQFSFGLILYEMLSARRAFERDTKAATLAAIIHERPEDIESLNPAVPVSLRAVLARCLEKDPATRFPNTRDLAIELRRIRGEQEGNLGWTRRRAVWVGGAAAAVAAAGIATWRLWPRSTGVRSLAVLPFANVLHDPEVDYLCEGIAQSLIRGISRLPSLTVRPHSAAANFREKEIDPREAGRKLAADAVVTGAVTRASGRLRITAELVEVATGARLWSNSYDRAAGDALGAQNAIAAAIVDEGVRLRLTGENRRQLRSPTKDPAAYELYLRAIHLWGDETEAAYLDSRGLLQQALARDPGFALAYAALATTYSVMAIDGYERPATAWPEVSRSVRRALDWDRELPDAHSEAASALFYFQWDWSRAEQEWERALQSRGGGFVPDFLTSRALQRWALGRTDEALALARKARELDPLSPVFILKEADLLLQTGQVDPASRLYEGLIGTDRDDPRAYFGLAEASRLQGRFDEAIEAVRRAHEAAGDRSLSDVFATARGADGYRQIERAAAKAELDALDHRLAEGAYASPLDFARAHARLGEGERALAYFEPAFQDRCPGLVFLNVDRAWDSVRNDERFDEAVRRVGLPG